MKKTIIKAYCFSGILEVEYADRTKFVRHIDAHECEKLSELRRNAKKSYAAQLVDKYTARQPKANKSLLDKLAKAGMITRAGCLHRSYANAADALVRIGEGMKEQKFYLYQWRRGGGYCKLCENRPHITDLLGAISVKYTRANDAPRGGKEGEYITITGRDLGYLRRNITQLEMLLTTNK